MSGEEGSKRKRPGKKGGSKKRRVEDVILEPVVNENNNNAEVIIPVQPADINGIEDAGYETPEEGIKIQTNITWAPIRPKSTESKNNPRIIEYIDFNSVFNPDFKFSKK